MANRLNRSFTCLISNKTHYNKNILHHLNPRKFIDTTNGIYNFTNKQYNMSYILNDIKSISNSKPNTNNSNSNIIKPIKFKKEHAYPSEQSLLSSIDIDNPDLETLKELIIPDERIMCILECPSQEVEFNNRPIVAIPKESKLTTNDILNIDPIQPYKLVAIIKCHKTSVIYNLYSKINIFCVNVKNCLACKYCFNCTRCVSCKYCADSKDSAYCDYSSNLYRCIKVNNSKYLEYCLRTSYRVYNSNLCDGNRQNVYEKIHRIY